MTTTQPQVDSADQFAHIQDGEANATRHDFTLLGTASRRHHAALEELLHQWDRESGPVDDQSVAAMVARYDL